MKKRLIAALLAAALGAPAGPAGAALSAATGSPIVVDSNPRLGASPRRDATPANLAPPIDQLTLLGNWKAVSRLLAASDAGLPPAARDGLQAYASLMQNSNNAAITKFNRLANATNLQSWAQWAEALAGRQPTNAVALFLRADALARLGRTAEATDVYGAALARDPHCVPALLGRGSLHSLAGRRPEALRDLSAACAETPQLAEVHTSLGAFWLRCSAPDGACEQFGLALGCDADSSLALMGRACARLCRSLDPASTDASGVDLAGAAKFELVRSLVASNLASLKRLVSARAMSRGPVMADGTTINIRELLGASPSVAAARLSGMSDSDLMNAYTTFGQNARWSAIFVGIGDKLNGSGYGFGLNLNKWSDTSLNDEQTWFALQAQALTQLQSRNLKPPGGARTSDLAEAFTDAGGYPFNVPFALWY